MGDLPKLSRDDWKKVTEAKGYHKKYIVDGIYKKYNFNYIEYLDAEKQKKRSNKKVMEKKQIGLF